MNIFLVGHPGSKHIISATSWLTQKYLPKDMSVKFINSGKNHPIIHNGTYVDTGKFASVSTRLWSHKILKALRNVEDPYIILGLDDYFLTNNLRTQVYNSLLEKMKIDKSIVCAHLSISPEIQVIMPHFKKEKLPKIFELPKDMSYLISTQYSIWRTDYLIYILRNIKSPWEFEFIGSKLVSKDLDAKVIQAYPPALAYPEPSALSERSPGFVSVLGNKAADVLELVEKGYLDLDTLIMGQWKGKKRYFKDFKYDQSGALDACPPEELRYYRSMLRECLETV